MSALAITGIGELVTHAEEFGTMADAALVIDGDRIAWVGPEQGVPAADRRIDAAGRAVIPGFVDSHTHLVFAGDRSAEFAARMAGKPYTAGGIRTTVAATRAATDAQLQSTLDRLMNEALAQGTTTVECKSGYGLTVADEARLLRIAGTRTEQTTFLGAHVVPEGTDTESYVDLVCGQMLEACAPLARWIDVFCERGAFDADATRRILRAGTAKGLGARLHACQLRPGPAVQLAVEFDAASVDHCTHLTKADIDALSTSDTVATLLPGVEFATRQPYPDAQKLLDAGATVALATDCNPGSCYTTSMPFCIALAVRELGMTPAQALWSATAGGARALRLDDAGVLRPGSRADLAILDAPSALHLAYRPGVPLVAAVIRGGTVHKELR